MFDIDQMKADMARPAVKKKTASDWVVVTDGPAPGWVEVQGPSFKVGGPTTATDLNGEDYAARHADARRIARVPDLEAEVLRLTALVEAADALYMFVELVEGSFGGGRVVTFSDSDIEEASTAMATYRALRNPTEAET